MSRPDLVRGFALGAATGAWVVPIAAYLAARFAGRHVLDIVTKENR